MKKIHAVLGTVAGAVILAGTGTGIALADSTASPTPLYACVSSVTRTIDHAYTNAGNFPGCPSGEFAINVGAQGPAGQSISVNGSSIDPSSDFMDVAFSDGSSIDIPIVSGISTKVDSNSPSGYDLVINVGNPNVAGEGTQYSTPLPAHS